MQVSNINVNANLSLTNKKNINNRKQNFGGVFTSVGNANKTFMHFIEKGGFFAEFCIMDMCGLVLPRVYQGFQRNKEELGHLNYQAGTEEFLREFITGPSMFLIPIAAVMLAGHFFGQSAQITSDVLKKFSEIFKSINIKNIPNKDVTTTQKEFAGKLFDDLFTNAKDRLQIKNPVKSLDEFKKEFVEQLTGSIGQKLTRAEAKARAGKFNELIADINTVFFKNANRENTFAIPFSLSSKEQGKLKMSGTTASDLFDYARKYMEDVINCTKLSVGELKDKTEPAIKGVIEKITNVRLNCREVLCVGGTLALAGFLWMLPKIYQISKKNPALNGLEDKKQEVSKC